MIYYYGDSFTDMNHAIYRMAEIYPIEKDQGKDLWYEHHYVTKLSNKLNSAYTLRAIGGWSNKDIVTRVINDLQYFTKEDTVIIGCSEDSRVMMPANISHTVQNKAEVFKKSIRAEGYPLIAIPSTLLADEYENHRGHENEEVWKAGLDYFLNVTSPYRRDFTDYWRFRTIHPLASYISTIVKNVVCWGADMWRYFPTFETEGLCYDAHFGIKGNDEFATFLKYCIDENIIFPDIDTVKESNISTREEIKSSVINDPLPIDNRYL